MPCAVTPGAGIVFGTGSIWGIFPDPEDEDAYLWRYDCDTDEWDQFPLEELGGILENSAITWQPGLSGSGTIWVVGVLDEDPMLFWYDIDEEWLDEDDAEVMSFGAGAALAHGYAWVPSWVQQVALNVGWLHCLEGGSAEFWRYGIPFELDAPAEDSIYPPDSSALHDPTPPFKWSAPDSNYRLVVATDADFSNVVIDQLTSTSSYEPTTALGHGQHFWKVGTSDGVSSYSWSEVRLFWMGAGWVRLDDLPAAATNGAALAYDYQNYYLTESPIAFRGGTGVNAYYRYAFDETEWTTVGMNTTPYQQLAGTSLANPQADATYQLPWAVFGQAEHSHAYYHHYRDGWQPHDEELPEVLGDGASIAYAHHDSQDCLYMVCGDGSTGFYRLPIEYEEEGGGETKGPVPVAFDARITDCGGDQELRYTLAAQTKVRVVLCDVSGRMAATLRSEVQAAGTHELRWNPRSLGLSAGAYVVILDAGRQQARLKVLVR